MQTKIMVDSSIWIEYFRGKLGQTEELIEKGLNEGFVCVTGPIVAELLQGVKNEKEYNLLSHCIDAIPYVNCEYEDWMTSGKIAFELRGRGIIIPLSDIVIATVAMRIEAPVYTLDKHFGKIPDLKLFEAVI